MQRKHGGPDVAGVGRNTNTIEKFSLKNLHDEKQYSAFGVFIINNAMIHTVIIIIRYYYNQNEFH